MARNGCSAAALVAEFRWTAPFPSTLALLLLLLLVNVNVEAVYNTLQCSAVTECMCVSVYKYTKWLLIGALLTPQHSTGRQATFTTW